ncbi:MAG: NUDIX hydrolase [Candidatus Latescibacteria bacterium]|nr:NUDIX hydrolase [Candidatus Latescibacterota bacterium]
MLTKQVFYQYPGTPSDGLERLAYCPDCGDPCEITKEGTDSRRHCEVCQRYHYVNPASAVSILVVRGDAFVLCRRNASSYGGGKWCLPCGFIEFREDFLTAGIRETKEETGLDIDVKSIISVTSNFLTASSHTLTVVLLAHATGGTLLGGDDIDEARWFKFTDLLPPLAFDADDHIISRYGEQPIYGAAVQHCPESARDL